jgi:hypothetical protein
MIEPIPGTREFLGANKKTNTRIIYSSLECDTDVYIGIKIKRNGRIFTFNSDSAGVRPLPEAR